MKICNFGVNRSNSYHLTICTINLPAVCVFYVAYMFNNITFFTIFIIPCVKIMSSNTS